MRDFPMFFFLAVSWKAMAYEKFDDYYTKKCDLKTDLWDQWLGFNII